MIIIQLSIPACFHVIPGTRITARLNRPIPDVWTDPGLVRSIPEVWTISWFGAPIPDVWLISGLDRPIPGVGSGLGCPIPDVCPAKLSPGTLPFGTPPSPTSCISSLVSPGISVRSIVCAFGTDPLAAEVLGLFLFSLACLIPSLFSSSFFLAIEW